MNIIPIESEKELPSGVEMNAYEPPYFTLDIEKDESEQDHALRCAIDGFRDKWGQEPETVFVHGENIYILKARKK